jgi:hypothetical protein
MIALAAITASLARDRVAGQFPASAHAVRRTSIRAAFER